jgi:uncharacterized membrane protein YgcG
MRCLTRLLLAVACAIGCAVVITMLAAPPGASAQTSGEKIVSYDASIAIQRDGSVLITEQIRYDLGSAERHGIIREIPVRFSYNSRYDRIDRVDVRSVQSPDAPHQYSVDNNGTSVTIKIGDPDQTVHGQHTYRLAYLVRDSLNAFADHDELYWNVTGNQWKVPIDKATVRVTAPVAVSRAVCYTGPLGSTRSCEGGGIIGGAASFTQAGLGPQEGVTVVVAVPKGAVTVPGPVLRERWAPQRAFALTPVSAGVSGGLLALLAIAGAFVLARGRRGMPAHDQPPIEPAPPGGLRPAHAGTLLTGVAGPREVTATIVDLAVRGYLRITDVPEGTRPARQDLRLTRLEKTGGLLGYEQLLLDGLFKDATADSDTATVQLSGLAMSGPLRHVRNTLYADMTEYGWFAARPDRIRRRWRLTGCAVFLISAITLAVMASNTHLGLVPIPTTLAGLAMIGGARWVPVRTKTGDRLARRLRGFRDYIKAATAGQARLTGQHAELYDYLPYAIVFGCTQDWADVTAGLADESQTPSWYRSSRPFNVGDLAGLSRSAYYFTTYHTAAQGWAISGTSASGGSGFSGGSSGGGAGGGGGGSW